MSDIVTTNYVKNFMDANTIPEMLVALSATDVGISMFTATNPGFTGFLQISSNNSVAFLSASELLTALGPSTVGVNVFSATNPNHIAFVRVNANNTISMLSASELLTALGPSTVGTNLFSVTDPNRIAFVRINANNTVSMLSASELLTAIGAGTGTSNITSVGITGPSSIMSWSTSLTSAGTLTSTLVTQQSNKIFAGPVSGSNATPTFRSLVYADLPTLSARRVTDDTIAEGHIQTNADNVGTDATIRTSWSISSYTLNSPTNGSIGQRIRYHIAAVGAIRTVTLSTVYTPTGVVFSGAIASGYTRVIELEKNGSKWYMTKNLEFET